MTTRITRLAALLTLGLVACGHSGGDIEPGIYRAVLQLPGGELPFGLDLEHESSGWVGYLLNGPERLKLSEVTVDGSHLQIKMPGYLNRLTADAEGDPLKGAGGRSKPKGKDQHLPLRAEYKQSYRFFPE